MLCDGEQRSAAPFTTVGHDPRWSHIENQMLFLIGAVVVLIALMAVVIVPRMWVRRGATAGALGWMSQRWLADHRASNTS